MISSSSEQNPIIHVFLSPPPTPKWISLLFEDVVRAILLISSCSFLRHWLYPALGAKWNSAIWSISRIYAHGKSVHWSCRILRRQVSRHWVGTCKIYCNRPDWSRPYFLQNVLQTFCCFLHGFLCWFYATLFVLLQYLPLTRTNAITFEHSISKMCRVSLLLLLFFVK